MLSSKIAASWIYQILVSVSVFATVLAYPPRDATTFSRDEETEPASHFSLDTARALLQSMRRTYTSGSGYYDRSLLEDGKEIPLTPVAPEEESQVDPESMVPRVGDPPMIFGVDPGALFNSRQSGSVGYNPNTRGVYRTWTGGSDFSLDNSNVNNNQPDILRQPLSNTHTGNQPVRQIFPKEESSLSSDNRTQEKIERDLWQPSHTTREEFLRCKGMSCEDKAMVEDLTALLINELTMGEYQPPEAAQFTVGQLQDLLMSVRQRRDLDLPKEDDIGVPQTYQGGQARTLVDFRLPSFNKWPENQPIPYMFDGSHTPQQQQHIRRAFQIWENGTCLTFRELDRARASEYARIHYVLVTSDSDTGCRAHQGVLTDYNPQLLNLAPDCLHPGDIGIAVHEIGHMLGYDHLHQRRDRDNYITINYENIAQEYLETYIVNMYVNIYSCPYDYTSIMHYGPAVSSADYWSPTMTAKDPLYQSSMGQRVGLSFMDAKCINHAYCSNVCRGRPLKGRCAHGGYQDPSNCNQCRCADGLGGQFCNDVEPSMAGCGGTINLQQGGQAQTINSPNYPRTYPENSKCNWKIVAPSNCKVQIDFDESDPFGMHTKGQTECQHWVEIKYKRDFGTSGPRLCGDSVGSTRQFVSETNEMYAMFRAMYPYSHDMLVGFKAKVSAVQCEENPTNTCGSGIPCRNGGQCVTDSTSRGGHRCVCPIGVTGTFCETECPNFNCNTVTPGTSVCTAVMDLVFILDSSGSVKSQNWPKMLEFTANMVDLMTIGADATRVGVVIFGNSATIAVQFWTNNDKELLKQTIRALEYSPQWTNTAAGLLFATQLLQQGRSNAMNKVILITDGPSNRDSYLTLRIAQRLRNVPATDVVAVAVGPSVDQFELQGITGSETKIVTTHFDLLADAATATTVLNTLCGTSNECTDCNSVEPPVTTDCSKAMDLVFILDSSGSVQFNNWAKMLEFAANMADLMTIGADATRVGVVVFGNSATIAVQFWTNNNKELLKQTIRAVSYNPQWTNTAAGLLVATQLLQQERNNAVKKVILITDGKSNMDSKLTLPNAQQLRNIGAEIVAVGVGSNVDQIELQGITGSQSRIVMTDFDALDDTSTATTALNTLCGTGNGGTPGTRPVSFSCDFETDFCDMVEKTVLRFTRTSGSTPTPMTGPSAAGQGRFYVFIETSYGQQRGITASFAIPRSVMTQIATPTPMCLTFKYHMYGSGIGTLDVYLARNGRSRSVFGRQGDQGNVWNDAKVSFNNVQSTDEILFAAMTTRDPSALIYQGDIALDDIRLNSGSC